MSPALATTVFSKWSKQPQPSSGDEHRRGPLLDVSSTSRSYGTIYNSPLEVHYEEDSRPYDIGPSRSPNEGPVYHGGVSFFHGESDDEEDWEMEQEGLYRGSYTRSMLLYSIVPAFALLWFILVGFVPYTFYPLHPDETPPSIQHLPFPLPEILLSLSLWSLSHTMRVPIYTISSALTPSTFPSLTTILFAFLTTTLTNVLRILAIPFLNLKITNHPTTTEPAFRCMWWFALAWAAADVVVGVYQGYDAIGLYKNSFVDSTTMHLTDEEITLSGKRPATAPEEQDDLSSPADSVAGLPVTSNAATFFVGGESPVDHRPDLPRAMTSQTTLEDALDHDLEQLISIERREELELIYGTPFVRIPIFVSCLLRLDTLFSTLGFTLLTSAAYLRYAVSSSHPITPHLFTSLHDSLSAHTPALLEVSSHHRSNPLLPLMITLPSVIVAHTLLSSLSMSPFLARVGVHSAAYVGVLVGLGACFAGMGAWEAVA